MPCCKLIVHADDFGLSEKTNEGILLAHECGILTSTSIIASGVAYQHAVRLWRNRPSLDVGVHLTLIEESPVLAGDFIPSLLGQRACFHRHASVFVRQYLLGKIKPAEVYRELDAQIRKVLNSGIPVTHLDSHQHVHMLPGILGVVTELAAVHGINVVRLPRERTRAYMLRGGRGFRRLLEQQVLNALCLRGLGPTLRTADGFVGFFFGGNLTKENLLTVLGHLPASGTCELMCHPGLHDPDSRYRHWRYRSPEELEALLSREARESVRKANIQLISFREL